MFVARTVVAFSILFSVAANAQARNDASLDVLSGASLGTNGSWLRETNARLALGLSGASAFAFFNGQLSEREGRTALDHARIEGAWQSRPIGAFRMSLSGASETAPTMDTGNPILDSRVNISARIGSGGVWFGGGSSEQGDLMGLAGIWKAFGRALVTLSVEPRHAGFTRTTMRQRQVTTIDTTYTDTGGAQVYPAIHTLVDTATEAVLRARPALELRGDWANGRWMVSASGVRRARMDSVPVTSAQVSIAARVNGTFGIVANAGVASRASVRDREPSQFVALGVRLWSSLLQRPAQVPVRPMATAFGVAQIADSTYRLTLRVPSARTAEVSGDFNQWTPVAMRETSPNTWEVTLPLAPGAHRINVRINGDRWTAPPGVPTVDDEFNGRVGLVIVR